MIAGKVTSSLVFVPSGRCQRNPPAILYGPCRGPGACRKALQEVQRGPGRTDNQRHQYNQGRCPLRTILEHRRSSSSATCKSGLKRQLNKLERPTRTGLKHLQDSMHTTHTHARVRALSLSRYIYMASTDTMILLAAVLWP